MSFVPALSKRTPSSELYSVLSPSTVNASRDVQKENACCPTDAMLAGRRTEGMETQSQNAYSPMEAMPSGMTTDWSA